MLVTFLCGTIRNIIVTSGSPHCNFFSKQILLFTYDGIFLFQKVLQLVLCMENKNYVQHECSMVKNRVYNYPEGIIQILFMVMDKIQKNTIQLTSVNSEELSEKIGIFKTLMMSWKILLTLQALLW